MFLTAAGDPGATTEMRAQTGSEFQLHEEETREKTQTQRKKKHTHTHIRKNPTLNPEVFQDFCKRTTWCDVFCAQRQRCLLLSICVLSRLCALEPVKRKTSLKNTWMCADYDRDRGAISRSLWGVLFCFVWLGVCQLFAGRKA